MIYICLSRYIAVVTYWSASPRALIHQTISSKNAFAMAATKQIQFRFRIMQFAVHIRNVQTRAIHWRCRSKAIRLLSEQQSSCMKLDCLKGKYDFPPFPRSPSISCHRRRRRHHRKTKLLKKSKSTHGGRKLESSPQRDELEALIPLVYRVTQSDR